MILEEDSILNFRYDTTTHLLSITWPKLSNTTVPEIDNSLQKLARNIKNFDIKKLLVDLRAGFKGVDNDAYKKAVEDYHRSLIGCRLEKVARIIPEKPAWEYMVKQYSTEMLKKYNLHYEVRFFTNKADALNWLFEPDLLSNSKPPVA